MSIKVISLVLDHYPTTDPCEQLVAIVLANYADDSGGKVFPSVGTIVRKTRLSERKVKYVLQAMRQSGWLIQTKKADGSLGSTNHYQINPGWIAEADKGAHDAPPSKEGHEMHLGGGTGCIQSVNVSVTPYADCAKAREGPQKPAEAAGSGPPMRTAGKIPDLPAGAPAGLTQEDWAAFVTHRKEINAPLTGEAVKRTIRDLANLVSQGYKPSEIIDQSIRFGWRGLFAVKSYNHATTNGLSARQRIRLETADALARHRDLVYRNLAQSANPATVVDGFILDASN